MNESKIEFKGISLSIRGFITLIIVGTFSSMILMGLPVPYALNNLTIACVSFYLGTRKGENGNN